MTIKICHKSFEDKLEKIGEGLHKIGSFIFLALQILAPVWAFVGIYQLTTGEFVGLSGVLFGTMITFMINLNIYFEDGQTIWGKINNKLKLFGWNEDC